MLDRFTGCIPGLFENDPGLRHPRASQAAHSHRPLDRLHQLAPEAGPSAPTPTWSPRCLTRCR
jgi:hypothetical protein